MSHVQLIHTYQYIISIENLLLAWKEFLKDKKSRKDVLGFERNLMTNIIKLHNELLHKTYKHGSYEAFKIDDPKPRDIHKAEVRDRLLHHTIYRMLYPYFDKKFIYDSYSCRVGKGTHKAIYRFKSFIKKVSKNDTKTCWVLKCDVKKFFANIDHSILKEILKKHIQDKNILWLLENIIDSFYTSSSISDMADIEKGLPLGNLTSQLLVNIYMNEFDQFVKHELKIKYYIRYADDFVVLSQDKKFLEDILEKIKIFLENNLKLNLHPNKVFIKTIFSGVDFLGWVHFSNHRVLRTSTKKRMVRKLRENSKEEMRQSYLGMLSHGDAYKLGQTLKAS
ncbi:MAG: Uncharacterized protein Athens071416_431 [Parcubacteria group bacterium Athens0714_16]|nr:MAG: Uncharacterized protein Athens071416_431 [Parcubacteria group bacterium Athens0714_16]